MRDPDGELDRTVFGGLAALLGVYTLNIMVSELTMSRKVKQTVPTGPPE